LPGWFTQGHRKLTRRIAVPDSAVSAAKCEGCHSRASASALSIMVARSLALWSAGKMKTRRMVYWWFKFVISGRFLEKFLKLRSTSQG
jgi:hypothetical protein